MIIRIPVGRIVEWAKDMKHGYSPLPEGDVHAFLNDAGLTWKEAKKLGGPAGDPWCRFCGRHARKHPDIEYPVFTPPAEWEQIPEADVPIGCTRPSGRPVRWPYLVVTERGLIVHLHAANEDEAFRHTIDYEWTYERNPVFVRLDFPVPNTEGTCSACGQATSVTTSGLNYSSPIGVIRSDELKGMCGVCSVDAYVAQQSGEECHACQGQGWTQDPNVFQGRPRDCHRCDGVGVLAGGNESVPQHRLSAPANARMPHPGSTPAAAPTTTPPPASALLKPGTKTCPDCAEEVRAAARKCRICGYMFEDVAAEI